MRPNDRTLRHAVVAARPDTAEIPRAGNVGEKGNRSEAELPKEHRRKAAAVDVSNPDQ